VARQRTGREFFEHVVFDAATGQRTRHLAAGIAGEQRSDGTRRRSPRFHDGREPTGFPGFEPDSRLAQYFVIGSLHGDVTCT
jgi:hypothetical protein